LDTGADEAVRLRAALLKGIGRGLDAVEAFFEGCGGLFHGFLVEQAAPEVNRILASLSAG
jgi:hypothetical protein